MSRNVDVVAVFILLLAAALFSGVKEIISTGIFGPSGMVRIERSGSKFYVRPAIPPMPPMPSMPPMPPMPQVQRN